MTYLRCPSDPDDDGRRGLVLIRLYLTTITFSWIVHSWTLATFHFFITLNPGPKEVVFWTVISYMKGIRGFIHNKMSQRIHILLIIILVIITDNLVSLGTHFYGHIAPCIHYTMINKGWTGVWNAFTVLFCSSFFPCFLCLRTSFHSLHGFTRISAFNGITQLLFIMKTLGGQEAQKHLKWFKSD